MVLCINNWGVLISVVLGKWFLFYKWLVDYKVYRRKKFYKKDVECEIIV